MEIPPIDPPDGQPEHPLIEIGIRMVLDPRNVSDMWGGDIAEHEADLNKADMKSVTEGFIAWLMKALSVDGLMHSLGGQLVTVTCERIDRDVSEARTTAVKDKVIDYVASLEMEKGIADLEGWLDEQRGEDE